MLQDLTFINRASKLYTPIPDKKFDFYFGTVYNRLCDKAVNFIVISFSVLCGLKLQDSGGYGHGKFTRWGYWL